MPRLVRARAVRPAPLSQAVLDYINLGLLPKRHSPGAGDFFAIGPPSGKGWQLLWAEHGERLVAEFAAKHPGRRPCWWWRHEAPEPRQQTRGERGETGALHDQVGPTGLLLALDYFSHDEVEFESEAAFLKRLGLLLPGEKVGRAMLKPEVIPAYDEDEGLEDEPD